MPINNQFMIFKIFELKLKKEEDNFNKKKMHSFSMNDLYYYIIK